ncbi:kinase-like domain-containing protein [Rhizophagus diaphanus]|nr:kinase-like domain-containing protein [Rhizophagus diaphanus] [Rhizophagus sp. MUCL 43196]
MSNNTEFNSNEWIDWIEEAIAKKHIKYYDYKHFNNIQEIGSGGFGKQIKTIIQKKYLMVMEYADSGTLRNYLSERFDNLTWNNKLELVFKLANAISCLHDEDIIHHDLHSNNILVHKNTIKLADFGLSKRIEESSNVQSRNVTSTVSAYSCGGRPPFHNKSHDVGLVIEILQGLREKHIPNTPVDYIKIYTDCWNNEPDNREQKSNDEVAKNIIDNSLYREMSQIIENFNKMSIEEIEPAIQKDSDSTFLLGAFNHFGIEVNVEKQKAFELYQNAANFGNVFGITSLGYCYDEGIGISVDKQKAFELYQEAANLGNPRGMFNLGICYQYGTGINIDLQKDLYYIKRLQI